MRGIWVIHEDRKAKAKGKVKKIKYNTRLSKT
jgi:hypothetical protein